MSTQAEILKEQIEQRVQEEIRAYMSGEKLDEGFISRLAAMGSAAFLTSAVIGHGMIMAVVYDMDVVWDLAMYAGNLLVSAAVIKTYFGMEARDLEKHVQRLDVVVKQRDALIREVNNRVSKDRSVQLNMVSPGKDDIRKLSTYLNSSEKSELKRLTKEQIRVGKDLLRVSMLSPAFFRSLGLERAADTKPVEELEKIRAIAEIAKAGRLTYST